MDHSSWMSASPSGQRWNLLSHGISAGEWSDVTPLNKAWESNQPGRPSLDHPSTLGIASWPRPTNQLAQSQHLLQRQTRTFLGTASLMPPQLPLVWLM